MAESPAIQCLTVSPTQGGVRLDVFVGQMLGLSRVQTKQLLQRRAVMIDGRRVGEKSKGDKLGVGSVIEVEPFTAPRAAAVVAQPDAPLSVVARGDDWLIADKPPGMAVHPLEEGETGTLLNAVAARFPRVQGVGEAGLRSGVVHRLDVETSGAVLLALDETRWRSLRRAFEDHTAKKIYRAVVAGRMVGKGEEVTRLYVAQHKPARVRALPPAATAEPSGTRECDLHWRALGTKKGATLVEVRLGTGFLHQIRVMLAAMGHPVLGDAVYGDGVTGPSGGRLMLHALSLKVGDVVGEAPMPGEFEQRVPLRGDG